MLGASTRSAILGFVSLSLLGCPAPPGSDDIGTDTGSEDEVDESTSESEEESSETDTPDLPDPVPLPDPMVVMTFNILCSFCDDTYDPWEDRIGYIADTIARHAPDLVGLQELFTAEEVQQLLDLSPDYTALFYSDDTSDYADATIWWRTDRYELVDSGFYWLSPAPDLPFSVGFADGMQFPRLVAWAQLRELSTQAELLFVDTHFDNNSPSQELSAPLLLERTEDQAGALPIVVVGDFNSRPDTAAYATLTGGVDGGFALTNSFDLAETWSVESNQDPVPAYEPSSRIDHVFVAGGEWTVPWWTVDTWVYGASGLHTSDHFAMATELQFEG